MKRIIDLAISCIVLLTSIPIFLILAYSIKAHDRGPIFYTPERVGRNKKLFRMYKFRTMVVNADKIDGPSTALNDQRITPIGYLLRKYKLDELPQLINVFKGDMSLVGPRPEIKSEVETYGSEFDIIFSVKPGITDLSSIEFRNESKIIAQSSLEDAHEAYQQLIKPRKLELQREYALKQSIWLDLKIMLHTILVVIGKA